MSTQESNRSKMSGSSSSSSKTEYKTSGGIVKTVILPYDEINNLKAEVEYLKQYKL